MVAPDKSHSGYSGAVTFDKTILVVKYTLNLVEKKSYKISGIPTNCIIIALDKLIRLIGLVILRINNEPNLEDVIRFFATLGACREAAFTDISAIAFSLNYGYGKKQFKIVICFLKNIIK